MLQAADFACTVLATAVVLASISSHTSASTDGVSIGSATSTEEEYSANGRTLIVAAESELERQLDLESGAWPALALDASRGDASFAISLPGFQACVGAGKGARRKGEVLPDLTALGTLLELQVVLQFDHAITNERRLFGPSWHWFGERLLGAIFVFAI
jgi:hypothetical protein